MISLVYKMTKESGSIRQWPMGDHRDGRTLSQKERTNGRLVTLFMSYTPEREYSQPTSILFSFFTLYFWNGDNSTLLEWDCIHLFIFALSSDGVSRTCLSTPHLPQTISETCWSIQPWQPCCNVLQCWVSSIFQCQPQKQVHHCWSRTDFLQCHVSNILRWQS